MSQEPVTLADDVKKIAERLSTVNYAAGAWPTTSREAMAEYRAKNELSWRLSKELFALLDKHTNGVTASHQHTLSSKDAHEKG